MKTEVSLDEAILEVSEFGRGVFRRYGRSGDPMTRRVSRRFGEEVSRLAATVRAEMERESADRPAPVVRNQDRVRVRLSLNGRKVG